MTPGDRYQTRMTETRAPSNTAAQLLFYAGAIVALSHLANEWVKLAPPWGLRGRRRALSCSAFMR